MSWSDALTDGSVALSGWFPAIVIFVLGGAVSIVCYIIKQHKSQENGSLGNQKDDLASELMKVSSNSSNAAISVVKSLVDDSVSLFLFNQNVYGKEDAVIENLNYVVLQYIQKRNSYNTLPNDCAKCDVLNKKLESLMKIVSINREIKFDENFVGLYVASNWDDFLDEKFVEFASPYFKKNLSHPDVCLKIVENILSKLNKNNGIYTVENDCSRVLQVFWDSLDLDLKYKIAIAYYWIFRDSSRKDGYLQKKFAKEIYNELGFEEIVREMMRRELNRFSTEIEVIDFANKYQLDEGKIKLRFDDIFAKPNFDYESFKDIK